MHGHNANARIQCTFCNRHIKLDISKNYSCSGPIVLRQQHYNTVQTAHTPIFGGRQIKPCFSVIVETITPTVTDTIYYLATQTEYKHNNTINNITICNIKSFEDAKKV